MRGPEAAAAGAVALLWPPLLRSLLLLLLRTLMGQLSSESVASNRIGRADHVLLCQHALLLLLLLLLQLLQWPLPRRQTHPAAQ